MKAILEYFAWMKSIRSWIAASIVGTFCYLAIIGKIDAEKVLAVVVIVINAYFLYKNRPNGGTNEKA